MPALRLLLLLFMLLPALAAAQTHVVNAPTLRYAAAGEEREVTAGELTLDVTRDRLPSRLTLRLPPAGADAARCDGDRLVAPPEENAAAAPPAAVYDPAAAVLVVLEAPGSNRDPDARDTVTLDIGVGDAHRTVTLAETASASGVFAGTLPPAGSVPCGLAITRGATVTFAFGGDEGSLPASISPAVDPAGLVFDAATGAPVDGVRLTLLGEDGAPATVLGDDGTTRYPATVTSGEGATDAGGHRYAPVPGRYRFPQVAPGRYRLQVEPPNGFTAPSAAPASALAAIRDAGGQPFRLSDASRGGIVVMTRAGPFAADVPVDHAAAPTLLLTRTTSLREASPGDAVELRFQLTNRSTAATGPLHLVEALPAAMRYRRGSMRGGAEPAITPDGASIDAALASVAPGATMEVRYLAAVMPGAPVGEARLRARVSAAAAASNVADAAVRIRPLLFSDTLTILGQVAEGACGTRAKGVAGVRLLLEDGSVVVTDRDGLYHLEGVGAGRHVVALDTASLPPGLEPIDCAHDTRSAGSATSRFVEGTGGTIQRVDFRVRQTGAAPAVQAALPAVPNDADAAGDRDWLSGRQPGRAWLFPAPDYNPRAPVTRVVIQHAPGERVALTIGGRPVDPLSYDTTETDGHGVAVSRWVGIPLAPGDNRLTARILAAGGNTVATLERVVTVSGPPVAAAFDAARSRLVADGATTPLVAVRVTDARGRPVRAGTLVPYAVEPPYAAADHPDAGVPVVGDEGIALLPLHATGQAGTATLRIRFEDGNAVRTSTVEAWLAAAVRQWTVVGFGAGSVGYDVLSRHSRALAPGQRDTRMLDGQLAVYAKGRVKGSWLLTLAYDSARARDPDHLLLGQIDPDRYYTVYGDGATQGHDAPTAGRLYLRLETRAAYALFGDLQTGLGSTGAEGGQLTRYTRTLTGIKAEGRAGRRRASGFAARTASVTGHDEIAGNGLTGPYRLRARGILPNTDTLRLEVRDRARLDRVVATTPLARHLDYEIDVDAGTLRFTRPVASRDAASNPIVIVADYEVASGAAARLAVGGRIERQMGALAVGATAIHDETRTRRAAVASVDARVRLGATVLRGEVATGGDAGLGGAIAYDAEVEHHRGGLDLLAYGRAEGAGFGLGQQSLVEVGTRKLGTDLRWRVGALGISATAWYQTMLDGPGERIAGQARLDWHQGPRTLFAAAEVANDRDLGGGDRQSRLLRVGGLQVLAGGALTLGGETGVAIGGGAGSVDFPVRHRVEAAWQASPALKLVAGYEIDQGTAARSHTAQAGVELTPWRGARLTTALGNQDAGPAQGSEQGRRFARYGIAQSLPLGAGWSLDATLDSAATLAGAVSVATASPFQPAGASGAFGQDAGDFTAATLGLAWRAGPWSVRTRGEYRRATTDTRWGASGDLIRSLGEGRTLAASARATHLIDAVGHVAASLVGDLALAWRPPASRWSLLDRLTLRHDRGDPAVSASGGATLATGIVLGASDQLTTRVLANTALNYRSVADGHGRGVEASLSYGIKFVRGRYADETLAGLVDATGFALRKGLGPHLDIGAAASVQHGWSDRRWAWSAGPSIGVSPAGDVWMTLGYNVAGYRDRDLAEDRYARAGPYLTMRMKFDAHRVGAAARALGEWLR